MEMVNSSIVIVETLGLPLAFFKKSKKAKKIHIQKTQKKDPLPQAYKKGSRA